MSADRGDAHRKFADAIIDLVRRGAAPWQRPWGPGERALPRNVATGRRYAGGNSVALAAQQQRRGYVDARWGTYRQIQARGGQVRKGQRGTRILSFRDRRRVAVRDERGRSVRDENGRRLHRTEALAVPRIRQYTVFNAEQADGLPAPERADGRASSLWTAHRSAEAVMADSRVPVRHMAGDRAMYDLERDRIVLPERAQFASANQYYQTALHELGHSTGHPDRMNRDTLIEGVEAGFGSIPYAREELRAEISAMMTGDRVGVGHDPRRGAAYVEGWIQVLENDPLEIRRAAADAWRISDYVLARRREREALPTRSGGDDRAGEERALERADRPRTASPPERAAAVPERGFVRDR